jgi:parvulin-like peptidyl-prolyl isomerase
MKLLWTPLLCACMFSADIADAFLGKFYDRVVRDLNALSSRSTTRHILLPKDAALATVVKQKIRKRMNEKTYAIDAFAEFALEYSIDKESSRVGGM